MQIDHCEVLWCCGSTTKVLESCADYGFDLQKLSQNIFTNQECSGAASIEVIHPYHPTKEITGNSVNKKWEKQNSGNHSHITIKVIHRLLQQITLPRFPLASNSKHFFKSYLFVHSCFRHTLRRARQSVFFGLLIFPGCISYWKVAPERIESFLGLY